MDAKRRAATTADRPPASQGGRQPRGLRRLRRAEGRASPPEGGDTGRRAEEAAAVAAVEGSGPRRPETPLECNTLLSPLRNRRRAAVPWAPAGRAGAGHHPRPRLATWHRGASRLSFLPPARAVPPPHLGRHRQVLGRRLQLQHRVRLPVAERRGGLRAAVPQAQAVPHLPARRLRGRRLRHAGGGGGASGAGASGAGPRWGAGPNAWERGGASGAGTGRSTSRGSSVIGGEEKCVSAGRKERASGSERRVGGVAPSAGREARRPLRCRVLPCPRAQRDRRRSLACGSPGHGPGQPRARPGWQLTRPLPSLEPSFPSGGGREPQDSPSRGTSLRATLPLQPAALVRGSRSVPPQPFQDTGVNTQGLLLQQCF